MNNYGLYAIDSGKYLVRNAYDANVVDNLEQHWNRTKLIYNGKPISESIVEKNNYGLYKRGSDLVCNGEVIAKSEQSGKLEPDDGDIKIGNTRLSSNIHSIAITKDDYIALRNGELVDGYSKYDENLIYNIVDVEDLDTLEEITSTEENQVDIIHNSFNNSLEPNALTDNTFLSVNAPVLAVRHFEGRINAGEGLHLHYFVDTKEYDSINKRRRTDESTIEIDETFTVIVKAKNNQVLYTATTYAGEFHCVTKPFKVGLTDDTADFVGETYFSIQCIDSQGRGSIVRYFDVLVLGDNKYDRIYDVTLEDLATFGITLDSGRYNYIAGARNKIGLQNLINWAVSSPNNYDGIRLYNPDKNIIKGFNNINNKTYYIDNHAIFGTDNDDNPILVRLTDYYLVYYDYDEDKLYGVRSDGLYEIVNYSIEELADSKIIFNENTPQSFTVNNRQVVVDKDPIEWILGDGAHLYRDSADKIKVLWGVEEDDSTKVQVGKNDKYLRTKNLNNVLANSCYAFNIPQQQNVIYNGEHFNNKQGYFGYTGYFYCIYTDKDFTPKNGNLTCNSFLKLPNNFTLDMNFSTIRLTDSTDLQTMTAIIELVHNKNVHILNGKFVGPYDCDEYTNSETENVQSAELIRKSRNKTLEKAVLRQAMTLMNSTWEHAGNICLHGSKFCTIENVENVSGGGYENLFTSGAHTVPHLSDSVRAYSNYQTVEGYEITNDLTFGTLGYIGLDGVFHVGANDGIIQDTGIIVNEQGHPYDDNDGQVRLVLSDGYIPVSRFSYKYLTDNVSPSEDFYNNTAMVSNIDTANMTIGAYTECFIYFYIYDSTNDEYALHSAIKSQYHVQFKIPEEVTHLRIGAYCWYTNDTITKMEKVNVRPILHSSSSFFINVYTHHTKSIAGGNYGVNIGYVNCKFDYIQDVLDELYITPMLIDIEENHNTSYLFSLIDCTCNVPQTLPGRHDCQTVVAAASRAMCVVNCNGIGYSGQILDAYVVNNVLSVLRIYNLGKTISINRGIVKHNMVVGGVELCYTTDHRTYNSKTHVYTTKNYSLEDVTKDITVEDCFIPPVSSKNGYMSLHRLPANYAIYRPELVEVHTRNEEGIIDELLHPDYYFFDFVTTEPGQTINIGYYSAGLITSIILDNEDYALSHVIRGSTSKIIIDEPGEHQMYIKHNVMPSNYFFAVYGMRIVRLPVNVHELHSGSMRIYIQDSGSIISLDPIPPAVHSSCNLSGASEIIIPEGSYEAYAAASVWSRYVVKYIEENFNIENNEELDI